MNPLINITRKTVSPLLFLFLYNSGDMPSADIIRQKEKKKGYDRFFFILYFS